MKLLFVVDWKQSILIFAARFFQASLAHLGRELGSLFRNYLKLTEKTNVYFVKLSSVQDFFKELGKYCENTSHEAFIVRNFV